MLKEALEYLVHLGKTEIINIEGYNYSTKRIEMVKNPTPDTLKVTTLTALVDYLKSNTDNEQIYGDNLLIHIVDHKTVRLYSEIKDDQERELYMECNALLPNNIILNRFINTEDFNIMLQSSFGNTEDKDLILKVTGCIQDKAVKEVGDDGVSQAVTIKTGVAKVNDVIVPNPVILMPFRTFPEAEQPTSKFVFRMQTGPTAALFEADGGAWRNEAMQNIAEYLKASLEATARTVQIIC